MHRGNHIKTTTIHGIRIVAGSALFSPFYIPFPLFVRSTSRAHRVAIRLAGVLWAV
jgi:hypothetical protein